MSLNVSDSYKGKVILITGCTGFLGTVLTAFIVYLIGKVVLEKILRSLSSV